MKLRAVTVLMAMVSSAMEARAAEPSGAADRSFPPLQAPAAEVAAPSTASTAQAPSAAAPAPVAQPARIQPRVAEPAAVPPPVAPPAATPILDANGDADWRSQLATAGAPATRLGPGRRNRSFRFRGCRLRPERCAERTELSRVARAPAWPGDLARHHGSPRLRCRHAARQHDPYYAGAARAHRLLDKLRRGLVGGAPGGLSQSRRAVSVRCFRL